MENVSDVMICAAIMDPKRNGERMLLLSRSNRHSIG